MCGWIPRDFGELGGMVVLKAAYGIFCALSVFGHSNALGNRGRPLSERGPSVSLSLSLSLSLLLLPAAMGSHAFQQTPLFDANVAGAADLPAKH
jgi:hypothetical protein